MSTVNKKCFRCGKKKPLDQFYAHKGTADGHLGKCKTCTRSDVAARYADPTARERIAAYERKRFKDPKRKAKAAEYQRRRRARSPEKNLARQRVQAAVRSGSIKKLPCAKCGSDQSQAHHTDYQKPLEVTWLCFKHHREAHGQKTTN